MSEDEQRVTVHGRVFQKISLDDNIYFAPVAIDDREEDRLRCQDSIISDMFGGRLFSPRIPVIEPRAILDCGYGGGDFAVQCAEEFEDCEVTGLDIFPMYLPDQPYNLELICYNLNDPFREPEIFERNKYDLIHSRFVLPGIKTRRWATYIRDMKPLLRPGGWVQIMEYDLLVRSHNGRLPDQSALTRWWLSYAHAMTQMNRDPRIGRRLHQLLQDHRYRDVRVDVESLHIGAWSSDAVKASLGRRCVAMIGDMLESLGIWPFTSKLGWTAGQFEHLMAEVRTELEDLDMKLYINL
ncbi:S-adenosyl-L-methionine-dependent methyltransferase [Decorospora gaudefroyi]|uniref:S-adenosyl-L-methionine-dependent methyltransferase n=1 Tax=Decorospora gaudefroyi TaxID=184978 RepID=A0A6A5KDM1_9PLEO|nr:S-adenosyl-L-methionine-dependent methyltransferase [Decorospora gaudefroyi]